MNAGEVEAKPISVDDLRAFCLAALARAGVGEAEARTTAEVLVTTDTWGVHTHGVKALRGYVRRLKAGGLRTDAKPRIVNEGPAWAIVDGDSGLGMVVSFFAMKAAIAKAKASGVGYAGVRNGCHFGAAGYYAAMAAEEGLIGLAMANDTPSVTIPGSGARVVGSNPFAYAIPTGEGGPILLDMAISTVAGGKVTAAHALGKPIPEGWVIDEEGRPTTDPGAFLRGCALTPIAGHKGYGLALMIESLAGVLTGAALTAQIVSWGTQDPTVPTGHGAAFLAIDVAAMMPRDEFRRRADGLCREMRSSPKAAGTDRIYVPGEMEWERRRKALVHGIDLPRDVLDSLADLARDLEIEPLVPAASRS